MDRLLSVATEVCTGAKCETIDVDGSAVAGIVAGLGGLIFFIVIIALVALGFWLWMLIDAIKTEESEYKKIDKGEKNLWVILMVVSFVLNLSFIMALVYYFVIYRNKKVEKNTKKTS